MASVTQITQYLYRSDPQKTLVRLTLFHFLKNACDLSTTFQASLAERFLSSCLHFIYWREKQTALATELFSIIEELHGNGLIGDPLETFHWLNTLQVIPLNHSSERQKALNNHLKVSVSEIKHRVTSTDNNQLMVMSLLTSGGLRVTCYSPLFMIRDGILQPLAPITDLEYTSYMELMPGRLQHLDLDGLRSVHFTLEDDSYFGRTVQGHHFQTAGSLHTREISSVPEIFYGLKALEKHFIDPKSDPFYSELIDQLERAYHLLSSGDPRGHQVAPAIVKKGQVALRNIFQKDKLLLLLVTNIEYMLNSHRPTKNLQEGNSQSWQKVRPLPK